MRSLFRKFINTHVAPQRDIYVVYETQDDNDFLYESLSDVESTDSLYQSEIVDEDSSEVSYDEDIDIMISMLDDHQRRYDNNVTHTKLNMVAELKRQLCFYRDCTEGKKWFLFHALNCIKQIGFYPPGMPYSKEEVFNMLTRHQKSLFDEASINIAPHHKFLSSACDHKTFEMIAKSPVSDDQLFYVNEDEIGQTLLHHATRWNNYDLSVLLLRLGFDPNQQDHTGKTPLFSCVGKIHHKKSKMPQLLLKYGADPLHKTNSGVDLVTKAAQKGNFNLVLMLVERYGCSLRKDIWSTWPKCVRYQLLSVNP